MLMAHPRAKILPLNEERRRHQRVRIDLLGRLMLENRQEYPCRIINMSPGGAAVMADAPGKVGERVIAYVDHLGRLEGKIARAFEGGFAMSIGATPRKREKLAAQLTWLANRQILKISGGSPPRPYRAAQPNGPTDPPERGQYHLPGHRHFPVWRRNCGPARAIAADRSCGDYRQDPGTRGSPHRRRFCYRVHPAAASRFCGRERHRRVTLGRSPER